MTRTALSTLAAVLMVVPLGCASAEPPVASPAAAPVSAAVVPQKTVAELPAAEHGAPVTDAQPTSPAPNDAHPTSVPIEGSDLVRGRSTVKVAAPIDVVRDAVLGFPHYPEFMPHYTKAKVLGRSPSGGKDVYMEVEALNGAAKMWARVDVPKAATVDGVETYETKMLDGNVKEFKAIWRLKKLDDASTELSLEVFMWPKLPLPSSLLNAENLKGSASGVAAMRARAEGKAKAP